MYFCENCYFVSERERCPVCGSKRLRQAEDDDYCLLLEDSAAACRVLSDVFDENEIPCTTMPYGRGVESNFALPLSRVRMYVPFKFLRSAKDVIRDLDNAETERLRGILLENAGKLNIPPKDEKKIRKKCKIDAEQDFYEYCIDIIKHADKIVDSGMTIGRANNEHSIYCYSENATLGLYDRTYEIICLTPARKA